MKLLILSTVTSFVLAAPATIVSETTFLESRNPVDSPRCGYVRLHDGDAYAVGIYSTSTCELIWKDNEATLYRIDEGGCNCGFFT